MKRVAPIAMILLGLFLAGFVQDAGAQSIAVKVHRVAMSPRLYGTAPAGTFPVSTGLRVVPINMKVYLSTEESGPITTHAWTIVAKPANSTAAIDTPANRFVRFIPDIAGEYIVQVAVDSGKVALDTLQASTYVGMPSTGLNCGTCHAAVKTEWAKTRHATMFTRGISGQLEVEGYGSTFMGVYSVNCVRCHTTGWDQKADNGNYGFLAKQTGFDTTWYKPFTFWNNEYLIPLNDSTSVRNMNTNFPNVAAVANIMCEACHGPGQAHVNGGGNKKLIGVNSEAGSCMQCHDAPNKHRIGSYWAASSHATMPLSGEEASRSSCWPCHNGDAFAKFAKNPSAPNYAGVEIVESISCVACHDPHSEANPYQLRIVTRDKLANGYVVPAEVGGKGQLCMNCHRARTDNKVVVEMQKLVFRDRFYPHYSPQADMYLGTNGYDYGTPIQGIGTHQGLDDGCVTCHMATRINGSSVHSNHEMEMKDAAGKDIVTSCKTCHGSKVDSFDDIQAGADYDGNGTIEAVVKEIDGMLATLKSILPKGADGEPLNMSVDFKKDSLTYKSHPEWYGATWNYYFVKNDWSHGIHNTKYAVALLRASLGAQTGVQPIDQTVPGSFSLEQNYPNPFNPSTTIKFDVARTATVFVGVYNTAGQLVATLADGILAPGKYSTQFTGNDLNSGTYFYRLSSTVDGKTTSITKKMVLVK